MTQRSLEISDLLDRIELLQVAGSASGAVTDLVYDSRKVSPGCAFFALPGTRVDGHDYIEDAVANGARVVVSQRPVQVAGAVVATVADSRRALALASDLYFGSPTSSMRVVGITGTNGKTTVTYLLEAMLQEAGYKPAVIGTVNYRFGADERAASHTTPESYELQQVIADFREQGADALVMEVSSHALEQGRVAGINFEAGIFTNLTPEHLDYHGTMESYFASKRKFFDEYIVPGKKAAVVNVDDAYGRQLATDLPGILTCGIDSEAMVRAENVRLDRSGIRTDIVTPKEKFSLQSPLLGRFNVSNLLCAIAGATACDLSVEQIVAGIARVPVVPGRIERIDNDRDALLLVDYAHTGDALENVLEAVSGLEATRIITVFGCGGDRDRNKRPVMGEVAARFSDLAIVTSDNPRTEDPATIIDEIIPGVEKHFTEPLSDEQFTQPAANGYIVIPDRRQAIRRAIEVLQPGDLLVVAGKGHEDYQIIGTKRFHFDDREEIRQALQARGGTDEL